MLNEEQRTRLAVLVADHSEWLDHGRGNYTPDAVREYVNALLAAERERVIEGCAAVCDEYPRRDPAEDGNGYWAAEECAAAIRALKGK